MRRFLKAAGRLSTPKARRRIRVEIAPPGRGAAERYVRDRFPGELAAYRRTHVSVVLIVMLDGDRVGTTGRVRELDASCKEQGGPARQPDEDVLVFVPTWRIESWFAYLDGETIRENKRDYPRLRRESDCQRHVEALSEICRNGRLREPAPSFLVRRLRGIRPLGLKPDGPGESAASAEPLPPPGPAPAAAGRCGGVWREDGGARLSPATRRPSASRSAP